MITLRSACWNVQIGVILGDSGAMNSPAGILVLRSVAGIPAFIEVEEQGRVQTVSASRRDASKSIAMSKTAVFFRSD
jgi:hypothetical protein